jgi:hypothetical protein
VVESFKSGSVIRPDEKSAERWFETLRKAKQKGKEREQKEADDRDDRTASEGDEDVAPF